MVKNRWKPDTCGCILEYEFDADAPEETRVHTPTVVVQGCAHHPVIEKTAHYEAVLAENRLKNVAMNEVLALVSESAKEEVKWSFNEKREVVIEVPTAEKLKLVGLAIEGVKIL